MNRIAAGLALIWIGCAPLTFGIFDGSFRGDYAELASASAFGQGHEAAEAWSRENCGHAALFSLLGPFGLVIGFLSSGFAYHGLSYSCDATP